ncbi:hypothetical protein Zm00014a_005341 [Zea mays]
MPIIF